MSSPRRTPQKKQSWRRSGELEALWIKMANCIGKTKRLEPMGTYIPSEDRTAMFHIEGLSKE